MSVLMASSAWGAQRRRSRGPPPALPVRASLRKDRGEVGIGGRPDRRARNEQRGALGMRGDVRGETDVQARRDQVMRPAGGRNNVQYSRDQLVVAAAWRGIELEELVQPIAVHQRRGR